MQGLVGRDKPQDSKIIEEVISGARKIASIRMPADKAPEVMNVWDKLCMYQKGLSMKRLFNKWKMPMGEYFKKFNSPLIRKFLSIVPFGPDSPMFHLLMHAACFHNKNASYPLGGAQELTDRLVHRYQSLGGKISYASRVTKICVEKGCAKGVQLDNGKTYAAEYIISAADGHHTVCDMLEGRYVDESIKELYYSEKHVPKTSQIYVSLGVARTFEDSFKPYVCIALNKHLKIGEEEISDVGITIHNFDPTAAPIGKTVLTMMIPVHNTEYWVNLRKENRTEYNQKKERIAQHMIEEIDAHFGHVRENVEMVDVATPATYIRYTNNWNGAPGAWQDWGPLINKPKKEIHGLKNFFLCGQWVGVSGLSGAAQSGRDIAQIFCKRDGKKFKALSFDNPGAKLGN